jgi:cobalamin-dependent methionine synthase I
MFVIANNISTRNAKIGRIFGAATRNLDSEPAEMLIQLAEQCDAAGADALEINIQQHYDRPEAMEFAINTIRQVTDKQLCLSTNNVESLEAGLQACERPPLVNYISIDETRLKKMLPMIAKHSAGIVLLVSDPTAPGDAREMLQKTAVLVGAANEAGIPNDSILVEILEFLRALPDATEPPVKSTCWLANCSAGAPRRLRPVIETTLLSMLAGAGLSSVFLDVLRKVNRQVTQLIKIFNNEVIYSDSELEP